MTTMERTSTSRKLVERRLASTNYRLLKVLGEGTYGTVYLARDGLHKQLVAIKVIEKRRISPDDMVRVRREIQVLSVLRQPNIIQIFRVHEDDMSLYLVMEYADGGELYDFVERRKRLSSNEARAVFRQIVAAVHYCHKNGIVHRDLKLENILLNSRYEVKLTDFGLCNYFSPTSRLSTFCGSPLYASPEIISGQPYMGPEIDCWSLGVLLYALVYGSMPFGHAEFGKLRSQILSGQFFAPPDTGEFSDAHDLICSCLTVSPMHRATIDQISMHWWINVGYIHYSHCDIYGSSSTPVVNPSSSSSSSTAASSSAASPAVQPMCSCFFDVLSSQFSKPPDSYKGKLATNSNNNGSTQANGQQQHRHRQQQQKNKNACHSTTATNTPTSPPASGDFVGVHARSTSKGRHRHHRHQSSNSRTSDSLVPTTAAKQQSAGEVMAIQLLPYPTPNSPPTPSVASGKNTSNGNGHLRHAVSVDSLNGCSQTCDDNTNGNNNNNNNKIDNEDKPTPWKFFSKHQANEAAANGRIVEPLRIVDADDDLHNGLHSHFGNLSPSAAVAVGGGCGTSSAVSSPPFTPKEQQRSSSAPGFLHGKTLPLLLPLLDNRRSSSVGRRPLAWKQNLQRPGDTLLSSLLDPSVEHLDWTGVAVGSHPRDVLHRQMSNYDNLGNSPSLTLLGKSPPRVEAAFLMDMPAPFHHLVDGDNHRQVPHSNHQHHNHNHSHHHSRQHHHDDDDEDDYDAYSPSSSASASTSASTSSATTSSSCTSGSLSCSCSCSSLYDGFVGAAAMPLQRELDDNDVEEIVGVVVDDDDDGGHHAGDVMIVNGVAAGGNDNDNSNGISVPPLQFLPSPRDAFDQASSGGSTSTSNGSGSGKQAREDLVVNNSNSSSTGNNSSSENSGRSAPQSGALFSAPTTLVDSLSSSHSTTASSTASDVVVENPSSSSASSASPLYSTTSPSPVVDDDVDPVAVPILPTQAEQGVSH